MTITRDVQRQFFAHDGETNQVIRLPPAAVASPVGPNRRVGKPWTKEEHERFLEGLQMYPQGPWRRIANHVGTRTSRQTMTHAQKYRERISRLLVAPRNLEEPPSTSTPELMPAPCAAGIMCVAPPAVQQLVHHTSTPVFDELDLEILSSLLDDGADVSDDGSSSSSSDAQDDFFGDLLAVVDEDQDMLHHLSELDVANHPMGFGL